MSVAAICKRCGHLMIGDKMIDISPKIVGHFRDVHNTVPDMNPRRLNFFDKSQFKKNTVEYMNDRGGWSTFTSTLSICSEDYAVATIRGDDYYACKREETQKKFSTWLDDYFRGYYEKPDK